MSVELKVLELELELARPLRNREDELAFNLIERIRLARKRLAQVPLVQSS